MANSYTPERRAEILAELTLRGGNAHATARSLNIPPSSVRSIRDRAGLANPAPKRQDFEAIWASAETQAIQRGVELLPESGLRDVAYFAGIAADKHLDYSQGRKGMAVTVDQSQHLHIDSNQAIRALLEGRRLLEGPGQSDPVLPAG